MHCLYDTRSWYSLECRERALHQSQRQQWPSQAGLRPRDTQTDTRRRPAASSRRQPQQSSQEEEEEEEEEEGDPGGQDPGPRIGSSGLDQPSLYLSSARIGIIDKRSGICWLLANWGKGWVSLWTTAAGEGTAKWQQRRKREQS